MTRLSRSGFTLIEVVVAIAVFATMSVIAHVGLTSLMSQQKRMDEHAERMRLLQLTMNYLERDINQLAERSTRDQYGDVKLAVIYENEGRLSFTNSGLRNPAGLKRSRFQRVAYEFDENSVTRLSWPQLDGYYEDQSSKRQLIDNIDEFKVEFLDESDEWVEQWPPINASRNNTVRPRAIAVTLKLSPWGELRRIFPTPR